MELLRLYLKFLVNKGDWIDMFYAKKILGPKAEAF
jgi:hypothetical protein